MFAKLLVYISPPNAKFKINLSWRRNITWRERENDISKYRESAKNRFLFHSCKKIPVVQFDQPRRASHEKLSYMTNTSAPHLYWPWHQPKKPHNSNSDGTAWIDGLIIALACDRAALSRLPFRRLSTFHPLPKSSPTLAKKWISNGREWETSLEGQKGTSGPRPNSFPSWRRQRRRRQRWLSAAAERISIRRNGHAPTLGS